jgi:hypothetical protein
MWKKRIALAAGLLEDIADSFLVIMCSGAESMLRREIESEVQIRVDASELELEQDDPGLN